MDKKTRVVKSLKRINADIEVLDKLALDTAKQVEKITNMKSLLACADRLMDTIRMDTTNQEMSYIFCLRFQHLVNHMIAVCDDKNFIEVKYKSELANVIQQMGRLKSILMEDYKAYREKMAQIEKELEEGNKHIEQNGGSNDGLSLATPSAGLSTPRGFSQSIMDVQDLAFSNGLNVPNSVFISCRDLYNLLTNPSNTLVLDLRSEKAFAEAHLLCKIQINIPPVKITLGLSANTLCKSLPPADQEIFEGREGFDKIVLCDFSARPDNVAGSTAAIMRSIIIDWDPNRVYHTEPVILLGGILEFAETYPAQVTNAIEFINKHRDEELDPLLDLDDHEYPTWNDIVESNEELIPMEVTSFEFEDEPPLIPDFDRSLKPKIPRLELSDEEQVKDEDIGPIFIPISQSNSDTSVISVPSINRLTKPHSPRTGLVGMINIKNSCYMNTAMQLFRSFPIIKAFFLSNEYIKHYKKNPVILPWVAEVVKKLWSRHDCVMRPDALREQIEMIDKRYGCGKHEDAMEFFVLLINALINDTVTIKNKPGKDAREDALIELLQGKQSVFIDIFFHQIRIDKICTVCKVQSPRYETDSTIMLSVPLNDCQLEDLLEEYFKEYSIPDFKCETCRTPLLMTKTLVYKPPALVIVLKRYYQENFIVAKNTCAVQFPLRNLKVGNAVYNLQGTAMHVGTMSSGHYTSCLLINNQWYECSDDLFNKTIIESDRSQRMVSALFYSLAV